MTKIEIRPAAVEDAQSMADIFRQAVLNIRPEFYSDAEKSAWLGNAVSSAFWVGRILKTQPWIAEVRKQAVGFIEYLPEAAHIDCLYVHPEYQRRGIAHRLLSHIFNLAAGQVRLTTDASKAALPFFLKHGFQVQHENRIRRNGVDLTNYRMVYDFSLDC